MVSYFSVDLLFDTGILVNVHVQYILLRKLFDFYYIENGCFEHILLKATCSYLDFFSLCSG